MSLAPDAAETANVLTSKLPSGFEETLAGCSQFRILLVGNSGVGKSSLVSSIFNISPGGIDIAHDRAGTADITHGYTSDENTRLILHDSQGFEAGSTGNWDTAQKFLRDSSAKGMQDRVHAIWLCVEAPREGARLQQTGDEKLLLFARELHIPVIVVFTKYDLVINEQHIEAENKGIELSDAEAATMAEASFNDRIKALKAKELAVVKVSTDKDHPERLDTLEELTNVTRKCLGDAASVTASTNPSDENRSQKSEQQKSEQQRAERVSAVWAAAQRTSAPLKVETSISEGFKKYWRDLGKSAFFQGQTVTQCVFRIHDDILKVWNFSDPHKLLSQNDFFTQMTSLVSPLLEGHEAEVEQDNSADKLWSALGSAAPAVLSSPHMLIAAGIAGIGLLAFKFLYGRYQKLPLTARYLGAYIVGLTCVLHRLFVKTRHTEPPTPLSKELIFSVVDTYKEEDLWRVHNCVSAMNFMLDYEGKIKDLIYTTIPLSQPTHIPQDDEHIAPIPPAAQPNMSIPPGSSHYAPSVLASNFNASKYPEGGKKSERRQRKREDKSHSSCIIV